MNEQSHSEQVGNIGEEGADGTAGTVGGRSGASRDRDLEMLDDFLKNQDRKPGMGTVDTRFAYQGQAIRTVLKGEEPWFIAADVCDVLELANNRQVVSRLDDDEKGVVSMDTLGGSQEMTIINESGVYSLIFTSRKPEARAFRRWVTHEVLPSIRRTGAYGTDGGAQRTISSAASTFAIPGPGRYVVMARPNGEMNVHRTDYATVIPEIRALDCRIMGGKCIEIASYWQKIQEFQATGYDPTDGFAMQEFGKAIVSAAEMGRRFFYLYDKQAMRQTEAEAGGEGKEKEAAPDKTEEDAST